MRISSRTLDRWRARWKAQKKNPLGEVKLGKCARFCRAAIERLFETAGLFN